MANPLIVGDLVKAQIVTFDTNQVGLNTLWFLVGSVGGSPATDQDLASALDPIISPLIAPLLNDNAEYRGIRAQVYVALTAKPKWVDVIANVGATSGTGGSTAMAKQVAGITSWYTNYPKQANRGRTYWPFPSTIADTGDGVPSVAYINALNAIASAIRTFTSVSAGGRTAAFAQVLVHRKAIGTNSNIIAYLNRANWATQRRRGAFGRPQGTPPF